MREQDLLESFMNNASDRFYILDEGLNIVTVNDTALKKYGFTRKEIVGRKFSDVFPSIRGTGRQETYQRVIETGEPYSAADQSDPEDQYRLYAFKIEGGMGLIVTDTTEAMAYQYQLEALHNSSSRLAEADSLEEIAATAIETLSQTLGHGFGEIGFVEDDRFVFYASTTREFDEKPSIPLESKSIIVRSIKTGEMQLVPDVREDPDYSIIYSREAPLLSELCYPILVDDRAVGALNVESPERDAYSQNDIRLMGTLAQHVASSIRRLEHTEERETFHNTRAALYNGSSSLAEAKDIEEITSISKELLKKVLGHTWGSIVFVEGDRVIFNSLRDEFPKDFFIPLDSKSIIVRAIKTKETQLVHDITKDPDYLIGPSVDEQNILFSELTIPIVVDDIAIGAINVEGLMKNAFKQDDVHLLEILAKHVTSAVRRIREEGIRAQKFIELTYRLNNLEPGSSYISESHDRCFKIFAELSIHGVPGISLVRDDPEKLVERYGFDPDRVRLLSSRPIKGFEALNNLQEISRTISSLLKEENSPVILLDGIEYMISLFGFDVVYSFLQEKKFDILEANAILLIPIEIMTLDDRQKALLTSELKTLA